MPKLIILQGLQGSGKSTLAKEICQQTGAMRVSRDMLRPMLFESWSGRKEGLVTRVEEAAICEILSDGWDCIIDDMNLSQSSMDRWKRVAAGLPNCKIEVIKMDTPVDECVIRDAGRSEHKKVSKGVIMNTALSYGMIKFPKEQYAICDLDGTLANCDHRLPLIYPTNGQKKDYVEFYQRVILDLPLQPVIDWVNAIYDSGIGVILVTGRPDKLPENGFSVYEATEMWLKTHKVQWDFMFSRRGGNYEEDWKTKNRILERLPKEKILFSIDDRPMVVNNTWKANGVRCFPVGSYRWDYGAEGL